MRPLGIRTALNCKIKHFPLQGKWHLLSTYFPSGDWYLFIKWPWAIFLYTLLFNHKMLTTAQLVFLSSSLTCSLLWFIFTVDWLQKACRRAYKDREGGTFRLVVCILVLLVSSFPPSYPSSLLILLYWRSLNSPYVGSWSFPSFSGPNIS